MKNLTLVSALFFLFACSDSTTNSPTTDSKSSAQTPSTGNRFKDAAIDKIVKANSGLSTKKSQCVVEKMTADGQHGLGEINQMDLTQDGLENNPSALLKAYKKALDSCQ